MREYAKINTPMKKIIIKIVISSIALLALVLMINTIRDLKEENIRLKNNQEILLVEKDFIISENQKYKISDSLNAVRASELELTLKEYKRYRNEDLKIIKQLKDKKSDLQKIITSQLETINTLSAKLNDSINIDTITDTIDTLKCFNYKSKWTDIAGCMSLNRDRIDMQIKNRESLKVVETITYKRFLGFLWKTNKVKNKQVNILSENPNTEIVNCEYISIKQ